MGVDRRTKHRFQQYQERTNFTTMPRTLQREQKNIVTTDACGTGLGIALWQKQSNGDLKPIVFATRYLNDVEKNIQSEN